MFLKKLIPLKEKSFYKFTISGKVNLPDRLPAFILIDPNGVKHLLPSEPYRYYDLESKTSVRCRIDRINCNGKIYLEPEHPFYKLEHDYDFSFVETRNIMNSLNQTEKIAIFTDQSGIEINVPAEDVPVGLKHGEILRGKVVRIKGGHVFVDFRKNVNDFNQMAVGKFYTLTFSHLKTYGKHHEYFVLVDAEGRKFETRYKFYRKYGLQPGAKVICKLKYSDGQFFLEPRHPLYEIDKSYEFEVIGKAFKDIYPEGKEVIWLLKNDFGKDILLEDEGNDFVPEIGTLIKCKVIDIIKSDVIVTTVK
ncbi:MAG: hypothetical protein JW731_02685 [Bacteroidales bacterium]|nr:hypothetical protein [Bacteroidales bacterium]